MQILPYLAAAALIGIAVSVQPALNAILARSVGSANVASSISIAVALTTILIMTAIVGFGEVSLERLAAVPWWVYLAGIVGALFVGGGTYLVPYTGALAFFVCIIAGQLIGSTIADHLGAFGLAVHEASPMRLFGVALVIAGALLVVNG